MTAEAFNESMKKCSRFEVYARKEMFFTIFKSKHAPRLFERFANKYNKRIIPWYESLLDEERRMVDKYFASF